MMIIRFITIAVFAFLLTSPSQAQSDAPIEITADKTLEWHRADLQYVADGNAVVIQGDTTIKADLITADYRDSKKSSTDIYRLTGTGTVSIEDKGNTAQGDKLVYELDSGIATMTGKALTMTSPEQTLTATEKFEYDVNAGKLTAFGNGKVVRATDTLEADTITAFLVTGTDGKNTLDRLEATQNVKITTPTETLTGAKGVYNAKSNTAIITGNVKITRGPNVLTGERAEVDLNTDISRLFGSSIEDGQTGGRVKGIFYPENNSPEAPKAQQ
ncbi:MAG: LptA/OstA family protein [Micavibrio sp.]